MYSFVRYLCISLLPHLWVSVFMHVPSFDIYCVMPLVIHCSLSCFISLFIYICPYVIVCCDLSLCHCLCISL